MESKYPKMLDKYRVERVGGYNGNKPEAKSLPKKSFKDIFYNAIKARANKAKIFFKNFLKVVVVLVICSLFYSVYKENSGVKYDNSEIKYNNSNSEIAVRNFPKLNNPKTVNFKWEHKGKDYNLSEVLYESSYNFYKGSAKEYFCQEPCPIDWEKDYWKMFVKVNKDDDTFSKLVADIKLLGERENLSDDEVLDLAMSFVQSIPYDHDSVKKTYEKQKYPYETLYDNKGICGDKSFLAAIIAKNLGYGVALLPFETENHMAIGIKCPIAYANYQNKYCYTEVTSEGWKIGIKDPEVLTETKNNITNLVPVVKTYPKAHEMSNFQLFQLLRQVKTYPEIYEISEGKTYSGIIGTTLQIQDIQLLSSEIEILTRRSDDCEQTLKNWESKIYQLEQYGSIYKYNSWVDKYNNKSDSCQQEIDNLNGKIENYNNLIEDF